VKPYLSILRKFLSAIRSPVQLKHRLVFSRYYWHLLDYWKKIDFLVRKSIFAGSRGVRSGVEAVSIFRSILFAIFGPILLAVILVTGMEVIEGVLIQKGVKPALLLPQLKLHIPSTTFFLSTLVQVAGVFLALYFTAVSIIVSTVYVRVPVAIRDLLVREKIGNLYIQIVALLAAAALLLLGQTSLGFTPAFLNILLVLMLGIIAIFSFVVLGRRAFLFLDPTALVGYLSQDLQRLFNHVSPSGFSWQDPAFQAHYQRQAEEAITTYGSIVSLATREEHLKGERVNELALHLLLVWQSYAKEKLRIPSESYWYKRMQRHRDWLTMDYSQISLHLRTSTAVQPELVPDEIWLESQLEEILLQIMQAHLTQKDLSSAVDLGNRIQDTLSMLGRNFAIDESLQLFRNFKTITLGEARRVDLTVRTSGEKSRQLGLALALTDIYLMGLMSILLGLSKRLESVTAAYFGNCIAKISWKRPKTVYSTGLPRRVVKELEYLDKGLEFERKVEGREVSPLWYQQQLAALEFVRFLESVINGLIGELETTFAPEAEALASENQHIFSAQLIRRGLETCHKYLFHLEMIRECFGRLVELQKATDIPWPVVNWDELNRRVEVVREGLIVVFGGLVPHLASLPPSKILPDYFGQAYSVLAEECYAAIAKGNEVMFERVFPPVFAASLAAKERLSTSLLEYDEKTRLIFSTEPIADILALSGHALIQTELDGKGYWGVTKYQWDKYFAMQTEPTVLPKFLTSLLDYRTSLFSILPRDMARSAWVQDLTSRLVKLGLAEDSLRHRFHPEEVQSHTSPIIRAIGRGGSLLVEKPEDVFLVVYLMKRPESQGLEWSPGVRSFAQILSEEEASGESDGNRGNETPR